MQSKTRVIKKAGFAWLQFFKPIYSKRKKKVEK